MECDSKINEIAIIYVAMVDVLGSKSCIVRNAKKNLIGFDVEHVLSFLISPLLNLRTSKILTIMIRKMYLIVTLLLLTVIAPQVVAADILCF